MSKPKFSVGYNFDLDGFIDLVVKYSVDIDSIYFPIPRSILGSGRILNESDKYKEEIDALILLCHQTKITPFLLLNSTMVDSNDLIDILEYVDDLVKKEKIKHFIIADPYLIKIVRERHPDAFIEASTLCRIRTEQEAKYFKALGVNRFTADRETIRNLSLLKKLKEILPIKVLVNEACLKNCIARYSHYDFLCVNQEEKSLLNITKRQKIKNRFLDEADSMCVLFASKQPHKFFSAPFVRPEDLKFYDDIAEVFKLSTRNFDTKRIDTTLYSYTLRIHKGNLIDILNSVYTDRLLEYVDNESLNNINFFKKVSKCDDNCENCSFCKELMKIAKVKFKKI